jgi:hypothetical protein
MHRLQEEHPQNHLVEVLRLAYKAFHQPPVPQIKIFRKRRIQMKSMKKWLYVLIMVFIAGCGGGAQVASVGWQEQYDLGLRYLGEGGYEEAVVAFTAAIAIDPKQAVVYVGRGDAYVGLEQHETAVPDYEQAITPDESVAEVYIKLADSYFALGDVDRAREALERGLAATGDETISARLVELPQYIIFGSFRGELLQWQMLAKEGERALIITKDCVAVLPYQNAAWDDWDAIQGTTWENSSLRAWLNGSFYEEAFSGDEKARIQTTSVVNSDTSGIQPWDGVPFMTEGGSDTNDLVFLLSIEEANQYFTDDAARVAGHNWTAEEMALAEEWVGDWIAGDEERLREARSYGNGEEVASTEKAIMAWQGELQWIKEASGSSQASWWLRSPGSYSVLVAHVDTHGDIENGGHNVNSRGRAVRPALWINLE